MTAVVDFLASHAWAGTLMAALVGVTLAIVVHRTGRAVLRRVSRHAPMAQAVLTRMDRPAAALLPVAAVLLVLQLAPDGLPYLPRVQHFTVLVLIASLTWLLLGVISGVAQAVIDSNPVSIEDNLHARRVQTQTLVLSRSAMVIVIIAGCAMALLTFPGARQVGASLLASAGVLGIVAGIAARPVFANLISGLQIALAQPIRIDDVLIVNGEWGRVEEIRGTFVVLKIWDERRLIVPLQWFIEHPFENWTRESSKILGTAFLYLDYAMPVEALRTEARRIVEAAPEWDRRAFAVQVTDITERSMQVRVLVSAQSAGAAFDLRCRIREELLAFVAREYPQCLPQVRGPQPPVDTITA